MRVLGIDPGLSRCGLGIVDGPRSRPVAVRADVVRTRADTPTAARLLAIFDAITALIAQARPDAVAIERVFFDRNVSTGIGVAQAAGLGLVCAQQAGLPVVEYTPTEVKALVTGDGGADKAQVGYMVTTQLRLRAVPRPADAADALALALCHLHAGATPEGGGMSPRLAAAAAAAGPGAQVVRPSGSGAGAQVVRPSGRGGAG